MQAKRLKGLSGILLWTSQDTSRYTVRPGSDRGYGCNKGYEAKLDISVKILADGSYAGKFIDKVKTTFIIDIEIVKTK